MKKLIDIFKGDISKSSTKWIHYFEIYERYFQKFIGTPVKVLEIGVHDGGSLQMWKEYFGKQSSIVGIDILPKTQYEEDQIKVEIGSQNDINFLQTINEKYGLFDIIIDDGSHIQMDVLGTFSFFYPKLKKGGVYIVEDTHTSYLHEYSGGIASPFNFITIASRFVHDMNLPFIIEPYTSTLNDLKSINFYNSMIVFEKSNDEPICSIKSWDKGKTIINEIIHTPESLC